MNLRHFFIPELAIERACSYCGHVVGTIPSLSHITTCAQCGRTSRAEELLYAQTLRDLNDPPSGIAVTHKPCLRVTVSYGVVERVMTVLVTLVFCLFLLTLAIDLSTRRPDQLVLVLVLFGLACGVTSAYVLFELSRSDEFVIDRFALVHTRSNFWQKRTKTFQVKDIRSLSVVYRRAYRRGFYQLGIDTPDRIVLRSRISHTQARYLQTLITGYIYRNPA